MVSNSYRRKMYSYFCYVDDEYYVRKYTRIAIVKGRLE